MWVPDPETGELRRYKSSVQDLTAEGIVVSKPEKDRVTVPLPEGTAVTVAVWKGYGDYLFKSWVIKRAGGHLPQLVLARPAPKDVKYTPRRQYFRVDTRIPVKMAILDEDDREISVPAVMTDLSGGGCRLQTSQGIRVGALVILDFDLLFPPDKDGLDSTRPLHQIAAKVRSAFSPSDSRTKSKSRPSTSGKKSKSRPPVHTLGIEFDRLNKVARETLLSYVALRQREWLARLKAPTPDDKRWGTSYKIKEVEESLERLERELREADQEPPEVEPDTSPAAPEKQGSPLPTVDEVGSRKAAIDPSLNPLPELQSAPPPVLAPPPQGGSSGRKILLVEDEVVLRNILAETLQQEGYSVAEASNGKEALELALNIKVDLVITDLLMPQMNGWGLLSSLRKHNLDMPVLVITGYMAQEGIYVLTNTDISGFLIKPIDLEEMITAVERILSSKVPDRKYHILAVDDEEDVRLLISTCLEQEGFDVQTAKNGREALNKVRILKPDLVLLDIMMPNTGGFAVCRTLRADPDTAKLPVIMLTAKASAEYVNLAQTLKINGYIVKPFDPDTLVTRIRKVLQGVAKK